jgi:hypothetical protein
LRKPAAITSLASAETRDLAHAEVVPSVRASGRSTIMLHAPSLSDRGLGAIGLPELLLIFAVVITVWGVYRLRH